MRQAATIVMLASSWMLLMLITACGSGGINPGSHLRSDSIEGAMALADEGASSTVFVRVPASTNVLGLCLLDVQDCLKPDAKLISLKNVKGPFWRSENPLIVRTNLIISVVDQSTSERKIILRGKISRKVSSQNGDDITPPSDLAATKPVSGVAVAYDFHGTLSRDSSSAAVVRMVIQDGALSSAVRVKVKGSILNLRNSAIKIPLEREVDVMDKGVIDFTVKGLDPDTVYRIDNVTVEDTKQSSPIKVKDPYFISTAADSKISKSRRRLVLRALNEAYDWDHGMYDSTLGYAAYGGWCDRFYTWAANLEFKVRNQYSAQSLFSQYNALGDAQRITEMGIAENLAGDFIRYEGTFQGTHTFMVVAYDVATKQLWTVEGNFNNRVMRNQRKIYSPWMHGHLIEEQAK